MALSKSYYSIEGEILGERDGLGRRNYASDALGSVAGTTSTGSLTGSSVYSPYGRSGSVSSGFGWNGSSGYYTTGRTYTSHYVRARHYDSRNGRWSTVDPIWPIENAFAYAGNSPVTLNDPSGLYWYQQITKPHHLPYYGGSGILGGYHYGSYCGSDNRRNPGWGIIPQDCLDACCQIHDRCLEAHYGAGYEENNAHRCCDWKLHQCADWAHNSGCCSHSPRPAECRKAAATIMRGMWFAFHGAGGGSRPCNSPAEWPPLVRLHWGSAGCSDPTGKDKPPPPLPVGPPMPPIVPHPTPPSMLPPRHGGAPIEQ